VIDFRFLLVEDTYVVWLAGINRYLQLKEPAFRVFEQWAYGSDEKSIVKACSLHNSLPEDESIRFVNEIIGQVQTLFEVIHPEPGIQSSEDKSPQVPEYLSDHTYQIGNYFFRFIYRNKYLEDLFHPLFRLQEISLKKPDSTCFELFTSGDQDAFKVNDSPTRFYLLEEIDTLQGAVYMEILNIIHGLKSTDWMGVLHASAVTDGESAVIFTAPSGSGKSSIALLMMVNGFSILSDDFVPIAMHEPEVYHFPAGISVKAGAMPFLKEYLLQPGSKIQSGSNETEVYLPPPGEIGILASVPAKAIVFVNYDPEVEYDLKRESNLEVMNHLIRQSWIAGTPEAAERFLTWYFNLPVYTLRYSNNREAVEGMRELFV
jgi:hypothetical protein